MTLNEFMKQALRPPFDDIGIFRSVSGWVFSATFKGDGNAGKTFAADSKKPFIQKLEQNLGNKIPISEAVDIIKEILNDYDFANLDNILSGWESFQSTVREVDITNV